LQDKMAARSHARAAAATNSGRFRDEIVPVKTTWKDPKTGEEKSIVVDKDDGIREGVTAAQLGKLPAVFKKGGSTTAGNSSQVTLGLCVGFGGEGLEHN
jgi:acetyl-CoA acyltransferase 1